MRGVLVSLPLQDPSLPPYGIALLAGSFEKIKPIVIDANLDFFHFLDPADRFQPRLLRSSSQYISAFRQLTHIMASASDLCPGMKVEPFHINMSSWPDLRKISEASNAPLWRNWLAAGIVEKILIHKPDWVGLSVNFEGQLPAAFSLGTALKESTFVIWGGGLFNAFSHLLTPRTPIWDACDGVIQGPGEPVLSELKMTEEGIEPGLNMLAWKNGKKWLARYPNDTLLVCPSPDYTCFSLDSYMAAYRVVPYRIFDRCHWGKCAFCADRRYHHHKDRLGGNVHAVAREILELQEHHALKGIYFLDAELPVKFALELSAMLEGSGLVWGSNMRAEESLASPGIGFKLYKGGCRFLHFGIESASQTVLKSMGKGIQPRLFRKIFEEISSCDIGIHIYLMQGFPNESVGDLLITRKFILENKDLVDSFNISDFILYEGSPLINIIDPKFIVRTARPDFWSYPHLEQSSIFRLDPSRLEQEFYTRPVRRFPTIADSIACGDDFKLDYSK